MNCSRRPASSAVVIDSIARLSVRPPIFHHETVVLDCEDTRCRADQRVGQPFTCLRCRRPRHLQARSLFPPQTAVKPSYCAVYNLTERRFVAPFENLTLLGLMMGRRGRERNGGIGYGATIQAGLFAIDSQALPPGATSREECDVGRIR